MSLLLSGPLALEALSNEDSANDGASRAREAFFLLSPEVAGVRPRPELPRLFGIATDWPIQGRLATITSLVDGSACLLIAPSFVACGGHYAKSRVQRYLTMAAQFLQYATKTDSHPSPKADAVRFYIRTFDSLYVIEERLDLLLNRRSRFDPLFVAANDLMSEMFDLVDRAKAAPQGTK